MENVVKNTKLPEYNPVNPKNHVKKNHPRPDRRIDCHPICPSGKKSF